MFPLRFCITRLGGMLYQPFVSLVSPPLFHGLSHPSRPTGGSKRQRITTPEVAKVAKVGDVNYNYFTDYMRKMMQEEHDEEQSRTFPFVTNISRQNREDRPNYPSNTLTYFKTSRPPRFLTPSTIASTGSTSIWSTVTNDSLLPVAPPEATDIAPDAFLPVP